MILSLSACLHSDAPNSHRHRNSLQHQSILPHHFQNFHPMLVCLSSLFCALARFDGSTGIIPPSSTRLSSSSSLLSSPSSACSNSHPLRIPACINLSSTNACLLAVFCSVSTNVLLTQLHQWMSCLLTPKKPLNLQPLLVIFQTAVQIVATCARAKDGAALDVAIFLQFVGSAAAEEAMIWVESSRHYAYEGLFDDDFDDGRWTDRMILKNE